MSNNPAGFQIWKSQLIRLGYSGIKDTKYPVWIFVMRKPTNPVKIFSYKKSNYPARCRYQLWKSRNIRPDICYEKTLSVKVSVMKKKLPGKKSVPGMKKPARYQLRKSKILKLFVYCSCQLCKIKLILSDI